MPSLFRESNTIKFWLGTSKFVVGKIWTLKKMEYKTCATKIGETQSLVAGNCVCEYTSKPQTWNRTLGSSVRPEYTVVNEHVHSQACTPLSRICCVCVCARDLRDLNLKNKYNSKMKLFAPWYCPALSFISSE